MAAKKSAYLNDPNRIPTIYSRVERITLSDTPEGLNSLHTDDGGVVHFYLAPGARTLSVQEKQASAVAGRYISASLKPVIDALKSDAGSKKLLAYAIEDYARESQASVFEYDLFVDSLREDRKINGLIERMAVNARVTDLLGETDFNQERFHDEVVTLFDALIPETRADRLLALD
jgi:hypothetical protein